MPPEDTGVIDVPDVVGSSATFRVLTVASGSPLGELVGLGSGSDSVGLGPALGSSGSSVGVGSGVCPDGSLGAA